MNRVVRMHQARGLCKHSACKCGRVLEHVPGAIDTRIARGTVHAVNGLCISLCTASYTALLWIACGRDLQAFPKQNPPECFIEKVRDAVAGLWEVVLSVHEVRWPRLERVQHEQRDEHVRRSTLKVACIMVPSANRCHGCTGRHVNKPVAGILHTSVRDLCVTNAAREFRIRPL